jgi:transposase-like protein
MTFYEFNNKFPTERAAIDYFIAIRYDGILTCPHCGAKDKVYRFRSRVKVCQCKHCNNTFSPFAGTIFEKSSTDIRKWFYAIHLFLNGKKGISGLQLQREIGGSYKTSWRMLQQIRAAMGNTDLSKAFSAFVEVDETYVGGKPRKREGKPGSDDSRLSAESSEKLPGESAEEPLPPPPPPHHKRGRGTDKTPVIGVKERSSGRVYARVALPNEKGQKLTGKQLLSVIEKVSINGTTVISDDFAGYKILDDKEHFIHLTVCHSLGWYSAGKGVDTNGIENFWSMLKRGILGIYHHVSPKYLQRYVDEFCYRFGHRGDLQSFDTLLKQGVVAAARDAWRMDSGWSGQAETA